MTIQDITRLTGSLVFYMYVGLGKIYTVEDDMTINDIKKIVAQMTIEEKAALCSGREFWHTKKVDRLDVPEMMVSDGPHGLRKQNTAGDNLGINDSIKAVCFPAGCAAATSFNRNLMYRMGQTIGLECQSENVGVILGPAVNIKRSPLCGRNFEYYSEDPYVASEIATAFIKGVQSENVGTSIKHFAANCQETRRMSVDEKIGEQALNEIYLEAFRNAVINAKPWTVMSSYNKVNGGYVGENYSLLTETLRDKWNFDGFVMSDWGAVADRVASLKAGLDLEMPESGTERTNVIIEAVKNGELPEETVDLAVTRILGIVYRYQENHNNNIQVDFNADHDVSGQIAEETIVLLKNDNRILPLSEGTGVAFIGKYAQKPRFQGGGSSHINCIKVTSALDAAQELGIKGIEYAQGYDDVADVIDVNLEKEAIALAAKSEVAVIFAGLPDAFESEGFDRVHMRMPNCQNHLIEEVCKVCKKVVVVLHNGSPVEMPWADSVDGIIESYLGGEAVGRAQCRILYGLVNPSARLAETIPYKLEDNPAYLTGFGQGDSVDFAEGIFVGYRYYDKKKMPVRFPFGHGLSYTEFEYSNLTVDKKVLDDTMTLSVKVDVTNVGSMAGKEVVQLYVGDCESTKLRPVKELRKFDKIYLETGETKTVEFELSKRDFAYYETQIGDWYVESGLFKIMIGKSVNEILLSEMVEVNSTVELPIRYTLDSTFGDIMKNPKAKPYALKYREAYYAGALGTQGEASAEAISQEMNEAVFEFMPVHSILSFASQGITLKSLQEFVDTINQL